MVCRRRAFELSSPKGVPFDMSTPWILYFLLATTALAQTPPYGLVERQKVSTLALSTSAPATEMSLRQTFAKRHTLGQVFLTHAGDGSGRLFWVGKGGLIQVWHPGEDKIRRAAMFLVLTDRVNYSHRESGLFSMAFHPDYASNGRFYVHYVYGELFSRVAEFRVSSANPDSADASSERVLLEVEQRVPSHFGGQLAFGPDGYLYIALGDGRTTDEKGLNLAQNPGYLQGSILCIDVDARTGDLAYGIPADNPLVGNKKGWREEIWAWGLRNPWRFSFDRKTGQLWAGDVGKHLGEEINLIEKGKNYGWPIMEGNHCSPTFPACDTADFALPFFVYEHRGAASITGGYVYRGSRLPELEGAYVYGDFVDGRIWALHHQDGKVLENRLLAVSSSNVASFGEDEAGEIYILGFDGPLYVLEDNPSMPVSDQLPRSLSSTGLFSQIQSQTPAPGLIPYSVNAQLWSDGAFKTRLLALPGEELIGFEADSFWRFPPGAVFVKNFYLEMERGNPASRRIVETRLLVRNNRGEAWTGLSYQWNEAGTEAELLEDSDIRNYAIVDADNPESGAEHTHYFPSRTECTLCHTRAAGYVLGFHTAQLNKLHMYGEIEDHQLRSFNHIGLFSENIGTDYGDLPWQPDPFDPRAGVKHRARSYLDANCAQCHRPLGTGRSNLDLRFSTALDQIHAVDVRPVVDEMGMDDVRLISPGAPERSLVYLRMLSLDEKRMPPLASSRVDVEGAELIRQWIASMPDRTHIGGEIEVEALSFRLLQNYPNPFNASTAIRYQLAQAARVRLAVFDLLGRKVKVLLHQDRPAGAHAVTWDGTDESGRAVASGVYFYRLELDLSARSHKMILLR